MKVRNIFFVVIAVSILGIATLYAQEGGRRGRPGGPEMMRRFPVMAALDANADGEISAEEITGASAALRKLDKNGDGKLTEEEIRPNFEGGPGGRRGEGPGGPNPEEMVNRLLEFDKNSDGKLSKDEVPERMSGLFERGDANKDGVLTKDELRKLAEAQSGGGPRREDHDHE